MLNRFIFVVFMLAMNAAGAVDITTRAAKGSKLTIQELDANFTNLKAAVEALEKLPVVQESSNFYQILGVFEPADNIGEITANTVFNTGIDLTNASHATIFYKERINQQRQFTGELSLDSNTPLSGLHVAFDNWYISAAVSDIAGGGFRFTETNVNAALVKIIVYGKKSVSPVRLVSVPSTTFVSGQNLPTDSAVWETTGDVVISNTNGLNAESVVSINGTGDASINISGLTPNAGYTFSPQRLNYVFGGSFTYTFADPSGAVLATDTIAGAVSIFSKTITPTSDTVILTMSVSGGVDGGAGGAAWSWRKLALTAQ